MQVLPFEYCPNCDGYASESMLSDAGGETVTCYGCDSTFPMGENANPAGKCDWCHQPSTTFVCKGCEEKAVAHYKEQVARFAAKEKEIKKGRYSLTPHDYKRYLSIEVNDRRYWEYHLSRVRGEFFALYYKGKFEQVTPNGKAVTRILRGRGYKVVIRKPGGVKSAPLTKAKWFKHLSHPVI